MLIAIGTIIGLVTSFDVMMEHGLNNPGLVAKGVVSLALVAVSILVLLSLFHGKPWARWLAVVWFAYRSTSLFVEAFTVPQHSSRIAGAVLLAVAAAVLLFSRNVREFYRFQRSGGKLDDAQPSSIEPPN